MSRYIDADALKDVIQQHDYPLADRLNSIDNGMFTLGIFQAVDEQPTISPDEMRGVGTWLMEFEPNGKPFQLHCSVCDPDFSIMGNKSASKFCPDCGARLEGVSDDA